MENIFTAKNKTIVYLVKQALLLLSLKFKIVCFAICALVMCLDFLMTSLYIYNDSIINSIVVYVATVKVHIMLSIIYCTLLCGAHEYAIVCIEHTYTLIPALVYSI